MKRSIQMNKVHIQKLISGMSLHEKIGQLNQEYSAHLDSEEFKEKIRKGEIGSIVLALWWTL